MDLINRYRFGYSNSIKWNIPIESIGVFCGVIGAFIVANAMPVIGYPFFTISSILLIYTAWKQKNANLVILQAVFILANINGLYTFFVK